MSVPRVAIPVPTSFDPEYNERSWAQYARAVERAGGDAVAVPLDEAPAETARRIATCSAILLPGSGADVNPQKYGAEADPRSAAPDAARENVDELLLQDAHNLRKPILGICFGTQMLNVWRGGTLVQDLPTGMPRSTVNHKAGRDVLEAHAAEIAPRSLLASIVAPESEGWDERAVALGEREAGAEPGTARIAVNSSHHQAIARAGDGLRITAWSPEDGVIEAVEGGLGAAGAPFILGVQWHPERTYDASEASRALFLRFVAEARAWSPREPSLG